MSPRCRSAALAVLAFLPARDGAGPRPRPRNVGMGEQATYTGGTALNAGSFAVMPAKMVHYAWAGPEGVTFQLHSIGPWSITYVNPADDPRKDRPAGSR